MNKKVKVTALFLMVFSLILVSACSSSNNANPKNTNGGNDSDLIPIVGGTLQFPSMTAPLLLIIDELNLDEANGLDLTIRPTADIGTYNSELATGQVDTNVSGPLNVQRLRNEGAPIQMVTTYATIAGIVLVTDNPDIQSIQDIKGKKLAATVAAGEYQMLQIVAKKVDGIDLNTDVEVIQASSAEAWSQLKANRVDAVMVWEPTITMMLNENPDLNIFYSVDEKWREMTGNTGYSLSIAVREDFIKKYPDGAKKWAATLQDAMEYINNNIDEADKLVSEKINLPEGVFKEAVLSGRAGYDIRPIWEDNLTDMIYESFELATSTGYFTEKPSKDAFYKPE